MPKAAAFANASSRVARPSAFFSGKRQRLGQQGEVERCKYAGAGRLVCGQTVADAGNSGRRLTLLGAGPALEDPAQGRPLAESVFTGDHHAIIAVGAGGGASSGEDRGHVGTPKSEGKGVGMSQLPAQCERTIGGPGGLIRMTSP